MAQRFLVVLLQVVSLFLIMAVGFALGKADLITKKGTKDMSSLIMYGATPCLMISSLQVEWDSESLKAMGLTDIDWQEIIRKNVKAKFIDLNLKALEVGMQAAEK